MLSNNNKKASEYLSHFAALTRQTLEFSAKESIRLSDEIEMLRNYIELEQMRAPEKFKFSIKVEDELEICLIHIPPMLIQPFVENAIKHGFNQMESQGELKLEIRDKGKWIEFIIEDNGEGMKKEKLPSNNHKSMAINIFEKRRKLIQQKHKKDFKFSLTNLKDTSRSKTGVRVEINIPILEND